MAEHTPGPWSVGRTHLSATDPRIGPFWEVPIHVGSSTDQGNVLATAGMGGKGASDTSIEAVETNARLIAAAPDLLAACERVHGLLLADEDILTEEDWRSVGKQLYAAIAKVTGATP